MHAISSHHGNRPTHTNTLKQTHRRNRLQYSAPLSSARSVNIGTCTVSVEQVEIDVGLLATQSSARYRKRTLLGRGEVDSITSVVHQTRSLAVYQASCSAVRLFGDEAPAWL